ncbi:MAG: DNA primase [candidate division Zixibacteria bacterium]|nr:DNA primase [candidate division Zixibacteria bacterium]
MIPSETIEQVRLATDIVQVIGGYLKLKKRGSRYLAVCPFHTEKTPSFSISPDRQLYYCFGCGRGGTVFTFLSEHEGMSFVEAVKYLADKANIPIREDRASDQRREQTEKIAFANQVALEYFRKQLSEPRYAKVLDAYLMTRRGITAESIESFSLGLAGEGWDGLINYAKPKGLTAKDLADSGLAIFSEKSGKHFDRFRHRLMIPIFSLSQKPVAFGGRTLKKGEPAKYVNSPETAMYSKGNVLYGLNTARDYIKKTSSAIVVEGYFDVISLWQAGVRNVVASSGTAFTLAQARLLARFAEEVFLFFDADSAGRKAAMRSVDVLYEAGLEVKVVVAPAGEDPDSVAREHGEEGIKELLEASRDYLTFRLHDLDVGSAGIIGREKLVKELGALGSRISDPTRRSLFLAEAAAVLGVAVDLITNVPSEPSRFVEDEQNRPHRLHAVESDLLSLLMSNPGAIDSVFEQIGPDDFESPELPRLFAAMAQQYRDLSQLDAGALVDAVQDNKLGSLISSIAAKEWNKDKIDSELHSVFTQFLQKKQKRIRERLRGELEQAEATGNQEAANRIMEELKKQGL